MKAIRISIALLTFAAAGFIGLTAVAACNFAYLGLSTMFFTATGRTENSSTAEPLESVLTSSEPVLPTETRADNFINSDGVFFVFPDDETVLRKEFRSFKTITIETYEYEEIGGEYIQKKIPPRGSILAEAEYKFTKMVLVGREVSVETEKKSGVFYRFSGIYPDRYEEIDCAECYHPGELEGTIERIDNGRTVRSGKVRFYIEGC